MSRQLFGYPYANFQPTFLKPKLDNRNFLVYVSGTAAIMISEIQPPDQPNQNMRMVDYTSYGENTYQITVHDIHANLIACGVDNDLLYIDLESGYLKLNLKSDSMNEIKARMNLNKRGFNATIELLATTISQITAKHDRLYYSSRRKSRCNY